MRAVDRLKLNIVKCAIENCRGQGLPPLSPFGLGTDKPIYNADKVLKPQLAFDPTSSPDGFALSFLDSHSYSEESRQGRNRFRAFQPIEIPEGIKKGFICWPRPP